MHNQLYIRHIVHSRTHKMWVRRGLLHRLVIVWLICLPLAGCNLLNPITDPIEDAGAILDRAITTLEQAPVQWRAVLNDAIAKLDQLAKNVAQEVRLVLEDAIAVTGAEFRCDVDFLDRKVAERLTQIRDNFLGKPPTPLTPGVCQINPSEIQLTQRDGNLFAQKQVVTLYGFNFVGDNMPTAQVLRATGEVVDVGAFRPDVLTPYQININLQEKNFKGINANSALRLTWPNTRETNNITILLPELPPESPTLTPVVPRTVTVRGTIDITDDDDVGFLGSDEKKRVDVNQTFTLAPGGKQPFQLPSQCVDEVRVELDLRVWHLPDSNAQVDIKATLFEGSDCNNADEEDQKIDTLRVAADGSVVPWKHTLVSTGTGGGDKAVFDLSFTNTP